MHVFWITALFNDKKSFIINARSDMKIEYLGLAGAF